MSTKQERQMIGGIGMALYAEVMRTGKIGDKSLSPDWERLTRAEQSLLVTQTLIENVDIITGVIHSGLYGEEKSDD